MPANERFGVGLYKSCGFPAASEPSQHVSPLCPRPSAAAPMAGGFFMMT